jgi:hypothetical protein
MKKLILLSIFIIVSFTTKAQTLKETMDYIEANVQNYVVNKQLSLQCSENSLQKTTGVYIDGGRYRFTQLYLKDIKSVSYSTTTEGLITIIITGKCNSYIEERYTDGTSKLKNQHNLTGGVNIELLPSTPLENVNRIIKAIKHAAELEGATLIDEDLFKD